MLFEGLYGPTPQVDLDLQIARARVPTPTHLDFAELAAGIVRNNVGVDAVRVRVKGRFDGSEFVLADSSQRWRVDGDRAAGAASGWHGFDVVGWDAPETVELQWTGAVEAPVVETPMAETPPG